MTSPRLPSPPAEPVPDTAPAEPVSALSARCAAGTVRLYRVRADGSTRHVPYLADDHPHRAVAEWLSDRTDMDGAPLTVAAAETGLSLPTARRLLAALEWTEEIEAGEWDDDDTPDLTALFVGYVAALPEDGTVTEATETNQEEAA
jgi:hypothetical protein